MARNRYSAEQIIGYLWEAEVLLARGVSQSKRIIVDEEIMEV